MPLKALTAAIYALLPPIHGVLAEHPHDAHRRCLRCRVDGPCDHLEAAIDALDLVLRTRHRTRSSSGG